ncbi:MAG: D-alanine--D-alanine ligase [Gammaproteobacteria bacterium AqS3]|nr:D-alanine--D-alanine ligase [Gammaproteobacteria bacterium AqS3]
MNPERAVSQLNALGRIGVLCGGDGGERPVSLKSGERVHGALTGAGVDAVLVDLDENPIQTLMRAGLGAAVVMLHGHWGEDGRIQSALDLLRIPYCGSGPRGSMLAFDKYISKQLWRTYGLPTPDWLLLGGGADCDAVPDWAAGRGLCIKPVREGSSLGITLLEPDAGAQAVRAAYAEAAQYGPSVLAEVRCTGAEVTVGLLEGRTLPPLLIEPAGAFYDYAAKYQRGDTGYHCPAPLPEATLNQLEKLGARAFELLGCRSWGRVDFILDAAGAPQLIELNTVPGMTDHSLVPKAAAAVGIDFAGCVLRLAADALDPRTENAP